MKNIPINKLVELRVHGVTPSFIDRVQRKNDAKDFSINDYINMMGGLNNLLSGGSGEISLDGDDLGLPIDGGGNNQGFTTTSAGGVNFNWELNKKTKS